MKVVKGLIGPALCLGIHVVQAFGVVSASSESARFTSEYVRPASVPQPPDNVWSPARERLGRALFFDPRLSGSN
jgi:cytochrome c peroxidase